MFQEGGAFLQTQDKRVDEDAKTRGQQDQIEKISSEEPSAKKLKPMPKKSNTMEKTLEEGTYIRIGRSYYIYNAVCLHGSHIQSLQT